jgi:hypothetical protein
MRASASITASERLPWAQAPALTRFRPEPAGAAPTKVSFGPFRVFPTQFLLLEGDRAVSLGGRGLEILIVLLEHPVSAARASLP